MAARKTRKAFSLTEILISLIIIGIVGGAAFSGMWFAFNAFNQIEDYSTAEREIEQAIQRLSREFALIGLGMPNNADGLGTFALSFRGGAMPLPPQPITAFFGPPHGTPLPDDEWIRGGPVTISNLGVGNMPAPAPPFNQTSFRGPELFYAFGIPTGVTARITGADQVSYDGVLNLELFGSTVVPGADILTNFRWQGRDIGLQTVALPPQGAGGNVASLRSWVLLPTLRVPMRADNIVGNTLTVTVAPMQGNTAGLPGIQRPVMGVDEVLLMLAGRVFLDTNTNELRRTLFINAPMSGVDFPTETLARNIIGLHFTFDHEERILTMDIVAQGIHRGQTGREVVGPWGTIQTDRRVVVRSISWRIRN